MRETSQVESLGYCTRRHASVYRAFIVELVAAAALVSIGAKLVLRRRNQAHDKGVPLSVPTRS